MSQLRRLVELHFENQSTGNLANDAAVFTPDVVSVVPGAPTLHGLDAFTEHTAAYDRAFSDIRFEIRNAVEDGTTIVVEGTFTGTHTGPLASPQGDIPATGKSVSLDFADVYVLDGDRFGEHRIYFDSLAFMAQLGLM